MAKKITLPPRFGFGSEVKYFLDSLLSRGGIGARNFDVVAVDSPP